MLHQVGFALAGLTGLVLIGAGGGAACQWMATRSELAATPPPGRLVDVGGHRLHIWCTGSGSPTVVLDNGLGGTAFSWGYVQPEVARFTTVCSYERAGIGYSDPGPRPRTSRRIARELAALLDRSGVSGPVVLVGASVGGLNVRLFATEHQQRAAALVLVDASHEDYRAHAAAAGEDLRPPPFASLRPLAASVGLMRLLDIPSNEVARPFNEDAFAPEVRQYARAVSFRAGGYRALVDEFSAMPESEAQVRAARRPLTIPLVVVTAGRDHSPVHRALQRDQAALSSRSCQVIADSLHAIPRQRPDVVVRAIRSAVDAVRSQTAPACGEAVPPFPQHPGRQEQSLMHAGHRPATSRVEGPAAGPSRGLSVIGLSAYFHDSACCLLQDGMVTAAAQEERFSRRKHDDSLPLQAFRWCLDHAGLTIADVDCIAYYEDPGKKLERQLWQHWAVLSPERCLQLWHRARAPLDAVRDTLGFEGDIDVYDHHQSHAASAFLLSGLPQAAILTVDGVGEWATTTYGHGQGESIDIVEEVRFPDSLGLLYSTITNYLGFTVNDGEYKVMGLAPYGTPTCVDRLRALVRSERGGQFRLNQQYFDFLRDDRMHADALHDLLGGPPRQPHGPLLAFHRDLACSLQRVLEEILLEKVRYLHDRVHVDALCMAGGVALNCVANGRIRREGPFRHLFVQPAAGDAGGALGAAALAHVRRRGRHAPVRPLSHVYLGPSYSAREAGDVLAAAGVAAEDYRGQEPALIDATAARLMAGQVVAWFQGRMEFGPRALGARSILADPRSPGMRDRVNQLVKERESFRPFAPAVIESMAPQHFDLDHASPFMLETCQVRSAIPLPAITHVDGTARVQTVDTRTHPRFATRLQAFNERTGCPVLLNTSFNLRDEPIVASPTDALVSFARSPIDALVLEDFIVDRGQLPPGLVANCQRAHAPQGAIAAGVYTF